MRRSASAKLGCSAAGAQAVIEKPICRPSSRDRDRDRARSAHHDLRLRQHRLDEHVHGSLARAHVLGEAHAGALVAGRDALLLQHVGRLHRDEARLPVRQRVAGGLEHGRARAAAADPAFRDRAVRQDHRLGAGLGGGRRDRAHHGRERERLALGLHGGDAIEDVGARRSMVRSSRDRARAPPGSRDCARARTGRRRAAPPACRAPAGCSRASRSAD